MAVPGVFKVDTMFSPEEAPPRCLWLLVTTPVLGVANILEEGVSKTKAWQVVAMTQRPAAKAEKDVESLIINFQFEIVVQVFDFLAFSLTHFVRGKDSSERG